MTENCAKCGKQLGIMKYNPKKEWNIEGKLCGSCFRERLNEKHTQERVDTALEKGKLIYDPDASDEELIQDNMESQLDVVRQEAGTGWAKFGAVMSGNPTEQIIAQGLKALIDQNKIIIRQNELMLRHLSREKNTE